MYSQKKDPSLVQSNQLFKAEREKFEREQNERELVHLTTSKEYINDDLYV